MTHEPTTEMSRGGGVSELRERRAPRAPEVTSALEDVLHAGQRLVADRIDLVRLEVKEAGQRIVAGAVAAAVGAFLLAYAWVTLMTAITGALSRVISTPVAYLLVGLANVILGAALAWAGAQRMRRPMGEEGMRGHHGKGS